MRRALTLGAMAPMLLCLIIITGCGLVPIPFSRNLPDPIQKVVVLDERTDQPVADADVVILARPFSNWSNSFPPHFSSELPDTDGTYVQIPMQPVMP